MISNLVLDFSSAVSVDMKRDDLLHPFVSGNKFRKLKYNLLEAKKQKKTGLLTFGGAFSNHIAAIAYAGMQNGFVTIGIIRGDELENKTEENPTLNFAKKCGMTFLFVSRLDYQQKNNLDFLSKFHQNFENFFIIPEGGTNSFAVQGCEEIISQNEAKYDYICCPVGTGGTIAGISNAAFEHQKILGFPALKGNFLPEEICKFAKRSNWELINDFHFGGYAKISPELVHFMNRFYETNKIKLDPVYTAKMVFGIMQMMQNNYFANDAKILLVHTGGLQGISGMNQKLEKKQLPTITFDAY